MPQFRPLSETKFINDANLVAYYPLENTTDVKGGFNLTNNNSVAFNAAKFANGADFGSANTNKSLSINNNLGITTGSVTISAWVKINTEIASGGSIFFDLRNSVNDVSYKIGYQYNSGSRRLSFSRTRESIQDNDFYHSLTMGISDYYNLVLTYDGTTLRGYVNGASVGSLATSGSGTGANDKFVLGFYDGGSSVYSSAIIDDTAIFSRALSASEVNELYQGMTLGEYLPNSNTKLLLHLNGNSTDSSGNGNNGTDTDITWVDGKFGKCASFNGSTSVIQTPFTGMTAGTISLWYKGTLADDALFVVNQNTNNSDNYLQFRVDSTGLFSIYKLNSINYNTPTGLILSNVWTNIVITQTGSLITVYINGANVGSTSNSTWFNTVSGANQYCIGALKRGSQMYSATTGQIDEVIVKPSAWTPQRVAKYYTYAKGRFGIL